MPIIRHEINILTAPLVSTTVGNTAGNGFTGIDRNDYSGTSTVYIEVLYSNQNITGTSNLLIAFREGGTSSAIQFPLQNSMNNLVLIRFQLPDFSDPVWDPSVFSNQSVTINNSGAGEILFKSARFIIIQDTGTDSLIKSATHIEIGDTDLAKTTGTVSVPVGLTRPKYWRYDSDKWDGSVSFSADCTMAASATNSTKYLYLQESDGTGDGFTGWTNKITITTFNATAVTRYKSNIFEPINGRNYRIATGISSTMNNYSVYNAKIIVKQIAVVDSNPLISSSGSYILEPTTNIGQGFKVLTASTISTISVYSRKIVTTMTGVGSVSIYNSNGTYSTAFPTGTPIVQTVFDNAIVTVGASFVKFPITPTVLQPGNYFLVLDYSVANEFAVFLTDTNVYEGNGVIGPSWFSNVVDLFFIIEGGGLKKLQEQYLLANTTLSTASTQEFFTKWDSTEWNGVTNEYIHVVDASDNNNSVVDLITVGGTQLLSSIAPYPDSQYIAGNISNYSSGSPITSINTTGGVSFGTLINGISQSFTSIGEVITHCYFYLRKINGVLPLIAKLYSHAGTFGTSSVPNILLATSNQMLAESIGGSDLYKFVFPTPYNTTNGTNYVITLEFVGTPSVQSEYEVYESADGSFHVGNEALFQSGSWVARNSDLFFYINGVKGIDMPSSQSIDVRATTNSGNIYASRMLTNVTVNTSSAVAAYPYSFCVMM